MESWTEFCIASVIENIVFYLTGDKHKNSSIIKINNENLFANGELHFLCNFKAWKSISTCAKNCTNILQHSVHIHDVTGDDIDAGVTEEQIFKQLILQSNSWPIRIQQCMLQRERVCLFLNREDIIANSIKMAIKHGVTFGRTQSIGKTFNLKYQPDAQSDLTSHRLCLIKNIAAKALSLHGCTLSTEENCTGKYMFTSKSEGLVDKGYEKYICGVVKNYHTNSKEISLTWEKYVKCKVDQLTELSEHKFTESERNNTKKNFFLHNLANAIVTFELMAVKPSRSVVVGNDICQDNRSITNNRGASFVLYNTARIATIVMKFNEKVSCGNYPSLPDIEDVDFSQLNEEDEWELIYNFIFEYPKMIDDCLKYETNFCIYPQVLCLFLSRLCQKFSIYYRRIKILTEGGDHLISKMFARLYMLQALQVVLENALDILGITPVSRM